MKIKFYKSSRKSTKTYYVTVDNKCYRVTNRIGQLRYDNNQPYTSAHIIRTFGDLLPEKHKEINSYDVPNVVKRSLMYFCNVYDGRRFVNGFNHKYVC